ncbi:hypothetical protein QUA74_26910 [Microcoleus sp. LAD1_D3]
MAFYPLLPLLMRGFTTLGMQVEVVGVIINIWAFWGAFLVAASS